MMKPKDDNNDDSVWKYKTIKHKTKSAKAVSKNFSKKSPVIAQLVENDFIQQQSPSRVISKNSVTSPESKFG